MQANSPSHPWPTWLGIALEPRAYMALIYQLVGLPLGIAGFVLLVTGLSLSLGLAVLGIGLLLGFCLMILVRGLALTQGRIAWGLTGMTVLDLDIIPVRNGLWERFKALVLDPTTWLAQLYVLLRLPLGILGFVLMICLISLSSACILAAGLQWASVHVGPDGFSHLQAFGTTLTVDPGELDLPYFMLNMHTFGRVTTIAVGLCGLLGTLHLALGLTWLDGRLAKELLDRT